MDAITSEVLINTEKNSNILPLGNGSRGFIELCGVGGGTLSDVFGDFGWGDDAVASLDVFLRKERGSGGGGENGACEEGAEAEESG